MKVHSVIVIQQDCDFDASCYLEVNLPEVS
jgi:hypothetical protein